MVDAFTFVKHQDLEVRTPARVVLLNLWKNQRWHDGSSSKSFNRARCSDIDAPNVVELTDPCKEER